MSILPEAKLDILLAHHASLESQLLGQVSAENYVKMTRELAELNPLIDAVKAYRSADARVHLANRIRKSLRPPPLLKLRFIRPRSPYQLTRRSNLPFHHEIKFVTH